MEIRAPHNPEWMKRPARKQSDEVKQFTDNSTGDYNIWYGKSNSFKKGRPTFAAGEKVRCRCSALWLAGGRRRVVLPTCAAAAVTAPCAPVRVLLRRALRVMCRS